LASYLDRRGVSTSAIHGDRSQAERTRALEAFRGRFVKVLVATDVASRGLDIEDLPYVVNLSCRTSRRTIFTASAEPVEPAPAERPSRSSRPTKWNSCEASETAPQGHPVRDVEEFLPDPEREPAPVARFGGGHGSRYSSGRGSQPAHAGLQTAAAH